MLPAPPVLGPGGMDLTSLRAAALKSKKRKAEALEAALAAAEDAEMEEGEIPDEGGGREHEHEGHVLDPAPLPPTYLQLPPPPLQQSYFPPLRPQQPELAFVPPPAPHIHAIREEAKDIIGELLSYGVSPEYLLGVGISNDIVAIAFHELGFRLRTHLAHLAPPPPPHYIFPAEIYSKESRRNSDSAASGFEHTPPLSPRTDPERSPSPAPAPAVNSLLAEMEARTRKQLMERKAALASRNSEQAQLLQDEFERTLFASFAAPPPPPPPPPADEDGESLENYEDDEPSAPETAAANSKASDDASAASVGHLRAAIDSSEQVVYTPSGGPFANSSLSGSQTPTPVPTPRARPVAADFVDSNYREDTAQLVIELSDSEDDDDDDGDKPMKVSAPALRAVTALGPSRSTPPTPVHSPPVEARRLPIAVTLALAHRRDSESTATGGSEAKKRLEEKEDEIKKIMQRIQRMEDRKKHAAAGPGPLLNTTALSRASSFAPGSVSPSTPRSPVASTSRLPSPVAEMKQIEQAKEQVESLERERQGLLEVATQEMAVDEDDGADVQMNDGDEPPPTNEMLVDTAEPQASELPTSLPPVPVPPVGKRFSEYKSPFEHLSLSRSLQPLPPVARPIAASTSRLTPTPAQDDEAVRAWVAQKRGVDASKRLCQYDTEGGTCSDKACKSNHVSGYRIDDDDIVSYVLATSGLGTGEKRDVFARGLKLALDRLPRPLTLDTARRAAFLLWQESHPASTASST